METKIIKAVFGGGTSTVTNKRTRTDYGQVLEIIGIDLPDTFECIFSNSATSAGVGKKMIGSAQRVLIPDEYLTTGQTIYAWILLHDTEDDGRHMYSIRIPVADMPDTSPEGPTPVEQSVISQAITALNSAVTTTTQKAQEATESADRAEQAAEGVEGYAERAEAAQGAAESARDIALEAKVSAQASAATASEKASEAINSATTASQSALTAENASESASASADASYQNAETAYRYAQDSATSAGQADESAQTASSKASEASQKASEAAQSASTAVQAKTDAETAKTASETAQGLAETARNEAVTAKNDAESARDEAQDIVDGIAGKVEQIDSNTDRIESLEDDRYKPYPTDTASGSIASFSDGADGIPLKSCIVQIEPVQAGSGDPSPENVRPISGWTGANIQHDRKNLLPLNIWGGFNYNASIGKVFTPTMSDKSWTQGESSITYETTATYTTLSLMTPLLHKGTYHLGLHKLSTNSLRYSRYTLDKSFTVKQSDYISNVTNVSVAITLDEDGYIAFYLDNGSTASQTVEITIQVEVGDTESVYEPYTGQTYPITFPSEAGTIYGGYIDPINGELVDGMASVDMGTLAWTYYASGNYFYAIIPDRIVYIETMPKVVSACDKYAYFGLGTSTELQNNMPNATYGFTTTSAKRYIYLKDNRYTNVNDLVASLSGTQLVYALTKDSITTYHITPTENIKTLLGVNNIWSDTGECSVEYRADTRLYIDRLTEPDADMIADNNITSGSYFMVGNNLYLATANIASGASVIVGTNATKVSLAQALNEINQ